MEPTTRPRLTGLTWVALAVVYVVWGSTYLGIRVLVEYAPPLLSMGARFVIAGALLMVILAARSGWSALRLSPRQFAAVSFLAVTLLLLGNGMVAVAESNGARSGMTALLIAITPLIIVLLRLLDGDRPSPRTSLGIVIGLVGVAVLVGFGGEGSADRLASSGSAPLWTSLLIVGAATSWAFGSFRQSRLPLPANAFVVAAWEMLIGGTLQLVLGFAVGERVSGGYPATAWWALAYLAIFGSLLAFSAYVWLVATAPISLVATYAYVNPVIAVVLGWLLLREGLNVAVLGGGGLVVLAVALVISAQREEHRTPGADQGTS